MATLPIWARSRLKLILSVTLVCAGFITPVHGENPNVERDGYLDALTQFVRQNAKMKVNSVYVAWITNDDGQSSPYGYWKEDNSILLLRYFYGPQGSADYVWLHRKARVDLATDVVATREEVGSSTYLVSQEWVDKIKNACLQEGKRHIIRKNQARRKPSNSSASMRHRPEDCDSTSVRNALTIVCSR